MSAYVAGFFGFLGWVFRVICPFWVWGVSGHLSVFWLVGFVGVDGVFGDDFSGGAVDGDGVVACYEDEDWVVCVGSADAEAEEFS